jgi:nicotinamidase-related amidase
MLEVNGQLVCESLAEVVDPRRTALLVVDVQNDYCVPGGALEREGGDISMTQAVVPNVIEMVEAARRHGVKVVWIQQTWLRGGASDSPAWMYMKRRNGLHMDRCVDGTWGQRLVDGLRPEGNEPIIKKHRSSGFVGTNLDLVLRSNRIETTVVIGVMTEGCVESTARDAAFYDYYVVLTSDCMASDVLAWHEASLTTMGGRHDIVTGHEIRELWTMASVPDMAGSASLTASHVGHC